MFTLVFLLTYFIFRHEGALWAIKMAVESNKASQNALCAQLYRKDAIWNQSMKSETFLESRHPCAGITL